MFTAADFRVATNGTAYRSILVDLRPSMAEIRATLDRKWRNQLTGALRGNVLVELSQGATAVARFAPLLEETRRRKGFRTDLDASFYDRVQRNAETDERLLVAIAQDDGADVAGVVASVVGETAVYILGASTASSLKSKAAYVLHWQVMHAARSAGCCWYDLGGIDREKNPGVYHFKSGFGGHEILLPGPFEVRPAGFAGFISRMIDASYTRLKRWRS
jgi:lipid II:glycine glycyltransferase (peptidoglycan interpeptide bridge formation enzyme)